MFAPNVNLAALNGARPMLPTTMSPTGAPVEAMPDPRVNLPPVGTPAPYQPVGNPVQSQWGGNPPTSMPMPANPILGGGMGMMPGAGGGMMGWPGMGMGGRVPMNLGMLRGAF